VSADRAAVPAGPAGRPATVLLAGPAAGRLPTAADPTRHPEACSC